MNKSAGYFVCALFQAANLFITIELFICTFVGFCLFFIGFVTDIEQSFCRFNDELDKIKVSTYQRIKIKTMLINIMNEY